MNRNMLKLIAKVSAIQTVSILAAGKHPSYVLEKSELLCDPLAFKRLDRDGLKKLDEYFEKWHLEKEWNEYKEEAVRDWNYMPMNLFERKYKFETCKFHF